MPDYEKGYTPPGPWEKRLRRKGQNMTFQHRMNEAIGPCDRVTLARIVGAEGDTIKIQFETIDETLGPLMHPEYLKADSITPGKLVSAIEDAKKHIQGAVDIVTRTQENGQKEAPDGSA